MNETRRPYWLPLLCLFVLLDLLALRIFSAGIDWAPLWTGARLAMNDLGSLYDFEHVRQLQGPVMGIVGDHPFIYPPSALLMLVPLSVLPFWLSFALFTLLSLALFWWAGLRIGSDRWLLLLAPPVFLSALVGQTTLIVAALAIAGLSLLERHPARAGMLFALAAVIKPTLLVLAPIGLIAGGHGRALAWAVAAGAGLIALSLLIFGIDPWWAWLDALPRFQALFAGHPVLVRAAASPFALGVRLGFPSPWIIAACAAFALPFAWFAFARSRDVALRSVALLGGALLITPYAMNYEAAVLAPALFSLATPRLRDLAVPALYAASLFATASIVGLLAVIARFAWPLWRGGDQPGVQRRVDIPA